MTSNEWIVYLCVSNHQANMDNSDELSEFRRQWREQLTKDQHVEKHFPDPGVHIDQDVLTTKKDETLNNVKVFSDMESANLQLFSDEENCTMKRPDMSPVHGIHKKIKLVLEDNSSTENIDYKPHNVIDDICGNTSKTTCLEVPKNKNKFSEYLKDKQEKSERFLDIFLADLDEMNEIPFFDMELPREVAVNIFKHLDLEDLCSCAQVSRAWQSLAEDELLWSRLCHRLGYEQAADTAERSDWKAIVRRAVTMEQTLTYNWKNRVGGIEELSHIPGGVLTAVSSFNDWVLAGYTSLEVKLWNMDRDTECVLSPASRALVPGTDGAFISNYITGVAGNEQYSVARFSTGMVNIWDHNSQNTEPAYSFTDHVSTQTILRMSPVHPTVAMTYNNCVRVDTLTEKHSDLERYFRDEDRDEGGDEESDEDKAEKTLWKKVEYIPYGEGQIKDMLLLPKPCHSSHTNDITSHIILVAIDDQVKVHTPSHDTTGSDQAAMTDLYHTAFEPVEHLDFNKERNEVVLCVCKMDVRSCFLTSYQVQIYNFETCKEIVKLKPHADKIHVVNVRDSPTNLVFTGGYQRIYKYDVRIPEPVLSLKAHNDAVTQIQGDEWKIVSGGKDGYVCVWDQRMATKLWDMHNRHPVKYVHFSKHLLLTANVPTDYSLGFEDHRDDSMVHKRFRGSLNLYDFSVTQQRDELPSICQSTHDEPERYNYNVRLAMPYDNI